MPNAFLFPARARAEKLASNLECHVLEVSFANGPPKPAVKGGCFHFATVFKAFGGHWNHSRKVHVFDDWEALTASLEAAFRRQQQSGEAMHADARQPLQVVTRKRFDLDNLLG
ncbi:hypothetical protein [Variovorax sp. E3]|jgi:hypothetical protein|uniref:hypothetical protein n=1 Tax=Variovorax sp. E3 TaxID=1914993 RepID=UPI0018DDBC8E|nr:hypothetical protein [Variovorax sp. E3]